jgi:hypothetical protein
VAVAAGDEIVARHDRLSNAGETRYDWQHYIPLLLRKPGALRNGAPFADMPEPLQRLRQGLLRRPGGDRVMAQVAYFSDRGRPFQADRGRQDGVAVGGAGEARRNWFECS